MESYGFIGFVYAPVLLSVDCRPDADEFTGGLVAVEWPNKLAGRNPVVAIGLLAILPIFDSRPVPNRFDALLHVSLCFWALCNARSRSAHSTNAMQHNSPANLFRKRSKND